MVFFSFLHRAIIQYAVEPGVLITINEDNESRGRIGVRDQCEFLRLGKQSRRFPVLKILRTRFNCTLLFVERVTASRGDLYLRKSSNREETCTFSYNEILFLENTFTCSDVHIALYAGSTINDAMRPRRMGLCARVDRCHFV